MSLFCLRLFFVVSNSWNMTSWVDLLGLNPDCWLMRMFFSMVQLVSLVFIIFSNVLPRQLSSDIGR